MRSKTTKGGAAHGSWRRCRRTPRKRESISALLTQRTDIARLEHPRSDIGARRTANVANGKPNRLEASPTVARQRASRSVFNREDESCRQAQTNRRLAVSPGGVSRWAHGRPLHNRATWHFGDTSKTNRRMLPRSITRLSDEPWRGRFIRRNGESGSTYRTVTPPVGLEADDFARLSPPPWSKRPTFLPSTARLPAHNRLEGNVA